MFNVEPVGYKSVMLRLVWTVKDYNLVYSHALCEYNHPPTVDSKVIVLIRKVHTFLMYIIWGHFGCGVSFLFWAKLSKTIDKKEIFVLMN